MRKVFGDVGILNFTVYGMLTDGLRIVFPAVIMNKTGVLVYLIFGCTAYVS